MSQKIYLSKQGYENLKAEIHDLTTRGRKEASAAIGEARDKGDLSENAEYDAAKDAQGLLEARISKLQTQFGNAVIVDESKLNNSKVIVLSKVKIKNLSNNKVAEYHIVSETEADLKQKKISNSSPIGAGLMGKAAGDIAEITLPNGNKLKFELLEISI